MSTACVGRPSQPSKDVSSDVANWTIVVNRALREAHAAVLHPRDRLGKVVLPSGRRVCPNAPRDLVEGHHQLNCV
jgi:hypothetical protein